MEILKMEKKLCLICMEEHEVYTVLCRDEEEFKGEEVSFDATYEYCSYKDEYLETESMIKLNSLAMKDAYRKKMGLLTSHEIISIRSKYNVSQKDFADILDWGQATITRYENHQVQDRAHDDILRKIDSDPNWFLDLLNRARGNISEKAYKIYMKAARMEFKRMRNLYLIDSIKSLYADYDDYKTTGGVELNLKKVVEVINYFASKIDSLHKVKLMKMLWYGDSLSYKRKGKAITGLVYKSLPMGAVPVGSDQIIELDGVVYEEVLYDWIGYKFHVVKDFLVKELTRSDIEILDKVIEEVGHLNSDDIIKRMHNEDAYKCTEEYDVIQYSYAPNLSIR